MVRRSQATLKTIKLKTLHRLKVKEERRAILRRFEEEQRREKAAAKPNWVDVVATQRHGGIWPTRSSYKVRNTYVDSGDIK